MMIEREDIISREGIVGETGPVVQNESARVFLQPIAAPSILGLFAFAASTFILAAWAVGWYGTPLSAYFIVPFVGVFGGIVQLLAAMWAFRARDGVATAIHGTWGAFFLSFALLHVMYLYQPGLQRTGLQFPEMGFWFIAVAAISWVTTLAAMAQRWSLAAVLMSVSAGATLFAISLLTGTAWCSVAGGYLFILSALCALYDSTAQVLKEVYGHEVLKVGITPRVLSEPGIMVGTGEPGVIHGQR
ncbi:acetate uptake transporter [Geomesophilobacter sediminis]|uniref:Acetate uptake transporter n=1 Tax=Geomesophilobacter sediminis TaxID=2798584 RepID=A0A8J7SBH0_9BACT|nr:acetate uptake transporter [Geomesophilobacter sediminis]MBJ6727791.1 acetate uptake transporter [Geomesophilobacter sediminis]